ncbi:tyrosine/phenylalanine carboxypeptidase domain-containing protein [Palleronia sp.]|uniref:tyrosine/phenylalanine carboxypeptidase domain-containing protein n=1 Tax=Palleronia sp. TaxID=1940284 RepID=UPI0035C7E340
MTLDPIARQADDTFFDIETRIDWLAALSPTGNHERWEKFVQSGFRRAPPLTYPPHEADFDALREQLLKPDLDHVEHPLIELLLREKRSELQRQIDLVALREQDGFVHASIALFGSPDPVLMGHAKSILDTVPLEDEIANPVGAADIAKAALAARTAYRKADPSFDFGMLIEADINSALMVNHGDLWIDSDTLVAEARVAALIAHEVGTHVVTRHNGRRQPLRQLETGLPDYDELQEGLATLAEWLVGSLPPQRLRVLAARVIAADMAINGETLEQIFGCLHDEHSIPPHTAFDTAVRAKRGGGLTKDAVYLSGLVDLLAWLSQGNDIESLFAGKFALSQFKTITELTEEGVLLPPAVLPLHLTGEGCAGRLETARTTPITELYSRETP